MIKIREIVFGVVIVCLFSLPVQGQYCSASSDDCFYEYISDVVVGTINNTGTGCDYYADYTSLSTSMDIGVSYDITVTNGEPDGASQCGIWVDWNRDLDFDDSDETIAVSGTPGVGPYTATLTPPVDASLGDTRMRVRVLWDEEFNACGITDYGEVEDYTIRVELSTIKISGYVKTSLGVRINGVNMSASTGETTVTDALGYYELTVPSPFTGSITPSQMDWTFAPSSRAYLNATTDQVNQDFTATYTVSYGGGSGTAWDPYQIYTAAQMNAIGAKAGDWGKYFRLMVDIDLSGYDGKVGRPSFNRIGYYINNGVDHVPFTGVFDGGEYTISNFTFDSDAGNDGVGIFGYVDSPSAAIKNSKLINVEVSSTSFIGTGALIGFMFSGAVTECSVQGGTVSGESDVGGLVGKSSSGGTIADCSAEVNVSGNTCVGGIMGSTAGVVSDCYSSCNVTGRMECGGLIGEIGSSSGTVIRCSTAGSVTISYGSILDRTAGGIVGSSHGTLEYCYSTANVVGNGGNEIGGLVGRNLRNISNSYAMGSVSGSYPTGGLIGLNWKTPSTTGIVTNCYSTGASNGAGLIGRNIDGVITGSFWDTQTSGKTSSDGGTGKTTAEMQTEATFLAAGWDFIIETANGDEGIWYIEPNDYPRLCWEAGIRYDGGTGEPDDPYLIYTAVQMNKIGTEPNDWRKNFKLMADISLSAYSGSSYNIIGTSPPQIGPRLPFRGVFDGNYHSVSDFSYSSSDDSYVGLFGYVYLGIIKDLKVVSPNLTDPGYNDMKYVGAIAGCAEHADISGCSVVGGIVEGEARIGGLVGLSAGSFIGDCSSSASVSGTSGVGGLVGEGSTFGGIPTITDCYSQGAVSGNDCVGGFMGDSSDVVIVNCYSTGLVSGDTNVGGFSGYNVNEMPIEDNVIGSFWDVESSGEANSAAGTGKTTAQMQDVNTFVDAGWDFVGETGNGPSDDWAMPVGGGYPIIWYELPVVPNLPTFGGGSGTAGDPYLIGTEAHLAGIGHNARLMDKHFRLMSDLDMNGVKYYMIADRPYAFRGTFDGGGHTISNIVLESEFNMSYSGLIGGLKGNGASIQDLTLIEPNIDSTWGWGVGSLAGINENGTITNCHVVNTHVVGLFAVGGLVGVNYSYGRISGCSATGDVSENTFMGLLLAPVGGLVGENSFWSEIDSSYAKCDVSGDETIGGLVGHNIAYTTITNCYSQGTVTGTTELIGGLIGRNQGGTETNYCYSGCVVTGPAGTNGVGGFVGRMGSIREEYTACFWDSDVNPDMNGIGNANDPNVIGESTANMQTERSFTNAGWDFVVEVINGPNDFWDICEGMNYPKLSLQIPLQGDFVCPDGVTFVDFSVLGAAWLSEPGWPNWDANCDISEPNDNIINELDVKVFTQNWLSGL